MWRIHPSHNDHTSMFFFSSLLHRHTSHLHRLLRFVMGSRKILQVLPAGIRIQFVDYGNIMTIPNCLASCRRMKKSLSDCPLYAAKVTLAGMTPVNEGSCWDAETNAKFISYVLNREYSMQCVCLDADISSVRLMDGEQVDLVSRLIQENLVQRVAKAADRDYDQANVTIPTTVKPTQLQSQRRQNKIQMSQL
jgi:hypothetical protein